MLRPWISTNLAISADGKITSVRRQVSNWTSRADHERLLSLRATADALLVGRGTLVEDRMTMTVPRRSVQPLRCVVSSGAESVSFDHPVFQKPGGSIHWLVTGKSVPRLPEGAQIHRGSLEDFLASLASGHGIQHLHCEGGGTLIRALAALDAIDEFHITLAGHTIFGGLAAPTATGTCAEFLPQAVEFEMCHFEPIQEANECFLSYRRSRRTPFDVGITNSPLS